MYDREKQKMRSSEHLIEADVIKPQQSYCPTVPYPTLPHPTLRYSIISHPILLYPSLSYPILSYPTLPWQCSTLHHPTLLYPILQPFTDVALVRKQMDTNLECHSEQSIFFQQSFSATLSRLDKDRSQHAVGLNFFHICLSFRFAGLLVDS